MAVDLNIWYTELSYEFKLNKHTAWENAKNLKFWFSKHCELSLSQYITCKISYLQAADITTEKDLIQHLWDGLEAVLASMTPIVHTESLNTF